MNKRALLSVVPLVVAICIGLAMVGCGTLAPTLAPTPTFFLHPFSPMFTLTVFPPTATQSVRPIPPLPAGAPLATPAPRPGWLGGVSPGVNSTVSLAEVKRVCIRPASEWLDDLSPLVALFRAHERARDHLILEVNGVIPSELTWEQIVMPNSTHPGTAWVGVRTYEAFCWPAELATGSYEAVLRYPTVDGSATFVWRFVIED